MADLPEALTTEQKLARLNAWLDFWKFFLGSVVVALVSAILGQVIKGREVAIKESEEIGKYIPYALEADGRKRSQFADFFAHVTRDKTYRQQWIAYRDDIGKELDKEQKIAKEQKQIVTEIQSGTLTPEKTEEAQEKLTKLDAERRASALKLAPLVQPRVATDLPPEARAASRLKPIKLSDINSNPPPGWARVDELLRQTFGSDQAKLYDLISTQIQANGFHVHTTEKFVDLVGVRRPAINDLYDDAIIALWVDEAGTKHAEVFQATCDPGDAPEIYRYGHAQLVDGMYEFQRSPRTRGSQQGQIVLAQKSAVTVSRQHSDGRYEGIETGDFGILIKPGGTSDKIGVDGYGSQAIAGGKDGAGWKRLTEITTAASSAGQKTFRYFLFTLTE
jgi:hypothetical protein